MQNNETNEHSNINYNFIFFFFMFLQTDEVTWLSCYSQIGKFTESQNSHFKNLLQSLQLELGLDLNIFATF